MNSQVRPTGSLTARKLSAIGGIVREGRLADGTRPGRLLAKMTLEDREVRAALVEAYRSAPDGQGGDAYDELMDFDDAILAGPDQAVVTILDPGDMDAVELQPYQRELVRRMGLDLPDPVLPTVFLDDPS